MAANNEQNAARKAAADAAAREAAEKEAAAREAAANKTQSFIATCRVLLDGKYAAPGEKVRVSRDQFETLKRFGAIEGEWK